MNHARLSALTLLVAGLLLSSCAGFKEQARVRALEIGNPGIAGVPDGSYEGRYAYGSFEYVVRVTVSAGRMVSIEALANRDTDHAKAAEGVFPRILAAQSPDVDAVSGSTTTSKAFMKAVENALEAARR
jgi:uncharacterized protein with FMN-binding domain